MNPMIQLNPPLPVNTPKGGGWAHFLIDYGPEYDLLWVVFMDFDGACWTVPNPEIRMKENWSLGRRIGNRTPSNLHPIAPSPAPKRADSEG
jgi:hypothetical protein